MTTRLTPISSRTSRYRRLKIAWDLDGTGDFFEAASTPVNATPLTIACWVNVDALGTQMTFVDITDGADTNDRFLLDKNNTDAIRAGTNAAGAGTQTANTSTTIVAGTWNHCCGVYTSPTSRASFLNGGAKGTNATSRTPAGLTTINIGSNGSGGTLLTGLIADVAIWNIDLSDSDVAALAKSCSPLSIRSDFLVFYAPLVGRHTAVEFDFVGGRQLTINGNPGLATSSPRLMPRVMNRGAFKAAASAGTVVPQIMNQYWRRRAA